VRTRSGPASGWEGEPAAVLELVGLSFGEEAADVVADAALLGVAVFPLVGVDAQGGVGLSVAEAVLHVDDAGVER